MRGADLFFAHRQLVAPFCSAGYNKFDVLASVKNICRCEPAEQATAAQVRSRDARHAHLSTRFFFYCRDFCFDSARATSFVIIVRYLVSIFVCGF
jgi:hypothetical protein